MKISKHALIVSIAILTVVSLNGQTNLPVKNVILFKNDQAFIIKDGIISTPQGRFSIRKNIPKAKYGTIWFSSNNGTIKRVSGFMDSVEAQMEIGNISSLLNANVGQSVVLNVLEGPAVVKYTGTIKKVLLMTAEKTELPYVELGSGLLLLQTETGSKAVNISDIKSVDFKGTPSDVLKIKKEEQVLAVDFRDPKPTQNLKMMYLEGGIGWKPVYLLELSNDKKGTLTLNAETINKGGKLENTDLSFVIGAPNFRNSNELSALVSKIDDNIGYYPYNRDDYYGTPEMSKVSFKGSRGEGMVADDANIDPQLPPIGSSNEDFYIYKIKGVSLPAKSSASFELLKGDLDLEHIYKTNLNANSANDWTYNSNYYFDDSKSNLTYHTLKIKNNLSAPLTEGTVMIVNNEGGNTNPMAQDAIEYTPVKGESYINITEAQDIKTEHKETEAGRKENARRTKDAAWDLVTVAGEVKVTNYGQKEVKMNVKRFVFGKPVKSDITWKVETKSISTGLNSSNEITWEFSLKKGEEKIIKYTYEVYLRINQ